MPVTNVTDLDMELGNVDPTTGHADVSTGSNVLLATTYGSGDYAIHLSPIVFNTAANPIKVTQSTSTGAITFTGLSEQSAFGNVVNVTIEDVTDPNNPIVLGSGQTDGSGNFLITASYPTPPAGQPFFIFDGTRTIEVFATDASGNQGNPVTTTITNNLPAPASPAFASANGTTSPGLTNGVVSGAVTITPAIPAAKANTSPCPRPRRGSRSPSPIPASASRSGSRWSGTATRPPSPPSP